MSHTHHPGRRLAAFTLIELLVVVSIIALLIALLLPALQAARKTARSAVCKSQQHQVGIAVFSYRVDSKSWFPVNYLPQTGGTYAAYEPFGAGIRYDYAVQLTPYLSMTLDDLEWGVNPSKNKLQCPENGWNGYPGGLGYGYIKQHVHYKSSRVQNYMAPVQYGYVKWESGLSEGYDYRPKKLDPRQPSIQPLSMEITGSGGAVGYRNDISDTRYWHPSGTTNALIADGHVTSFKEDEFDRTGLTIRWPR